MAHAQGRRVERVTIEGTGDLAGYCYSAPAGAPVWSTEEVAAATDRLAQTFDSPPPAPANPMSEAEREGAVLRCLAGPEAERVHSGCRDSLGDDFDMRSARSLLGADTRPAMEVCADLTELRSRTRELLLARWSEVEAVALALECSGTLTGDQVRLLIRYAPGARASEAAVAGTPPAAVPVVKMIRAERPQPRVRVHVTPGALRLLAPRLPLIGRIYA
jgi:hypothetical protein